MSLDRLRAFAAVVFDMDGVLLDSEPLHHLALNRVLADEGHSIDGERYQRFVGTTLAYTWTELMRMLPLHHALEDYYRRFDDTIVQVLREGPLEPLPGARELIAALRAIGIPLGLATQSHRSWVRATLDGLAMADRFDAVVSGEEVEHGKPHPDLYVRACALLEVEPIRSLAIEDSLPGVRAARAAGMTVVGVRNAYAGATLDREAHLVVNRLDALLHPKTHWPAGALPGMLGSGGDTADAP